MVADPAVRSVRVAVALCDRFAELEKGPKVVSAAKGRSALVGFKGEDEAFSLRVNEAQQIYPEIWSHLDDGRKAFAARGVDMTGFDAIRENERRFKPTGVDIDMNYTQHGDVNYGIETTVKKANFNTGGLQRARLAIQTLQTVTPNIDWAAIAKAEADDPDVKAFRRGTIIKRIWMFALLIAVVGIPFWYVLWQRHEENVKRQKWRKQNQQQSYQPPAPEGPPANALPAAEQTALLEQATKLTTDLEATRSAWAFLTNDEQLRGLKAGKEPCAVQIVAPTKDAADTFIKTGDYDEKAFIASNFDAYLASDGVIPSQVIVDAIARAKGAAMNLRSGRATPEVRDAIAQLGKPIVFVIIDKDDEPRVTSLRPLKIEPLGKLVARGYVIDTHVAKIVCAATLEVKGSDAKTAPAYGDPTQVNLEPMLHRELEIRLREALAANVRAVAP